MQLFNAPCATQQTCWQLRSPLIVWSVPLFHIFRTYKGYVNSSQSLLDFRMCIVLYILDYIHTFPMERHVYWSKSTKVTGPMILFFVCRYGTLLSLIFEILLQSSGTGSNTMQEELFYMLLVSAITDLLSLWQMYGKCLCKDHR